MNKTLPSYTKRVVLQSLQDTETLARCIACCLKNGDILLLEGDLGSGKTTFARYLIQSFFEDEDLLVQSPTFTICQLYEKASRPSVWHFDFYRLEEPEEIFSVGYEEARQQGVILIEWPQKMQNYRPEGALLLNFSFEKNERFVHLTTNNAKWQDFFKAK